MTSSVDVDRGTTGRILLRLPKSLHAELVAAAAEEGVSLNQFAVAGLASAVHWRAPDGAGAPDAASDRSQSPGVGGG
jgi:hypothetical protein